MKTNHTTSIIVAACLAALCAASVGLQAATLTVTSIADSGPGTLRDALANANNGDTVDAAGVAGTITLTNGELAVPNSVNILGPGAAALTVSGNHASRVFHVTGTNVIITGLTIANGGTNLNGAGINVASSPGSSLAIDNCVLTNNNTSLDGGGIYNSSGVTLTVSNSTLSGNHTSQSGGGIFNSNATVTVIASTFSGNSAHFVGGGIMSFGQPGSAMVTVIASTFSSNSATGGGGIVNYGQSGNATLTVNASTFSGNSDSGSGGAVYNNGSSGTGVVVFANCILKAGTSGGNIYNYQGSITSGGYNLSSDNSGIIFLTATGDQNNTDPLLGPLQDNGGPTWTHALLPGSPAMDRGKRDAIPALASTTDQRGLTRPVEFYTLSNATGGDGSDIGAFEFQKIQPPIVTSTNDSGPGTLREALASAGNGDPIDATGVSGTITLTNGELAVPNSVNILGPGAAALTVSGNHASRVFNVTGTNVIITGLTIANGNTSLNGAGINSHGNSGSVLTVRDCVITKNTTTADGGGICNSNAALEIIASTLSANQAGYGGGIFNDGKGGSAAVTISSSTLSGNHAPFGGGVWNEGQLGSATLTISCSTLSSNLSSAGGGICNYGASGSANLKINASTFSGNSDSSGYGGGIFNNGVGGTGTVEVADTVLNAGALGANLYNYFGTITSGGYNLSSDDGGGFLTSATDLINTDPELGPLQDNGGPTATFGLLPGSPARDRGKRDAVSGLAPNTDQRGLPRLVDLSNLPNAPGGDGSDIGAFELQEYQPLTVANTNDSGVGSLRHTLASAMNGDTIIFSKSLSGSTIVLTNGQLNVPNSVNILGPGAAALTVSGNHASRVFNITGTNVSLNRLTIANGSGAVNGAGINAGGGPDSILTISDCIVTNNTTTLDGGGIYNNASVLMAITNCTVTGNHADKWGGGVYNHGEPSRTAVMTISASTINGNSASSGGGVMNFAWGGSATLTVNSSTITSNTANSNYGGGIYNIGNYSGNGGLKISSCTFSGNSAPWGSAICNEGYAGNATIEIGNTILDASGAGGNIHIRYSGTVISDGYNLSSDDGSGFLTATGDQNNTDSLLGPLQDNGGPTWTHALLPGSPAIDQGKRDAVTNLVSTTDQRGRTRLMDNPYLANATGGDGSDVGAFEAQYPMVINAADSGPGSLRDTLASAMNGDAIIFSNSLSGTTILLTSGQLLLNKNLTIDASALRAGIQINGNANSRVFYVGYGASVVLDSLTITNGNAISNSAGGIYNSGNLTVNRCTLAGNTATYYGGGIGNYGTLTVNQCTLSGNSCGENGGAGIDNVYAVTVNQSTLTGNTATNADGSGGIYIASGSGTLYNSIVAGNTGPTYNNIFGPTTFTGVNLTNGAPLLAPLGHYGGPTPTMPPLPGSPAIDGCTNGTSFTSDQRGAGFPRIFGPFADIGAVELQVIIPSNPPILTGMERLGNGEFQFAFTNTPGASFTVFTTTNIALPFSNWTVLGVPIEIAPGLFQFTDAQATNSPQRFYRVTSP